MGESLLLLETRWKSVEIDFSFNDQRSKIFRVHQIVLQLSAENK